MDNITNQVINVENPNDTSSFSPIPSAAWVKDLLNINGVTPANLSIWLADSIGNPNDPNAIYAGIGATGDTYIVALNDVGDIWGLSY